MDWARLRAALTGVLRRVAAAEPGVYAANAAFFILLSVFPAMLLAIGLLQWTPLTPEDLRSLLESAVPNALLPLVDYISSELFASNSPALLSLSALFALWTSSKGAYSLLRGLNRVFRLRESRNYVLLRLRCTGFTLLLVTALVLSAALHLFGRHLTEKLNASALPLLRVLGALLQWKLLLMAVLLGSLFALLYVLLPNHRVRFRDMLPGGFCAALGWQGFSALFSYYVNRFGHYSLYYGSLAAVAVTMLWLYVCLWILFLGALFNRALATRRKR